MKKFYSKWSYLENIDEQLNLLSEQGYEIFQIISGQSNMVWIIYFKNID